MALKIQRAVKEQLKARLAIEGPTGSGKTYDALLAAEVLGGSVVLVDTEHRSAAYYADRFVFDHVQFDPPYDPRELRSIIMYLDGRGPEPGEATSTRIATPYDVIIIDSGTHFWTGEGGTIDLKNQRAAQMKNPNDYTAWDFATPILRSLIDTILSSPAHVIMTMRSKMEYVQEKDERTGKTVVRKVGMAPEMRAGIEYEFTVVFEVDLPEHNVIVSKTRCDKIADRIVPMHKAGELFADLKAWLDTGEPMASRDDVEAIRAALNGPDMAEHRKEFRQLWGSPDRVKASDMAAVHRWLNALIGNEQPPAPSEEPLPAPASDASEFCGEGNLEQAQVLYKGLTKQHKSMVTAWMHNTGVKLDRSLSYDDYLALVDFVDGVLNVPAQTEES